MKSIPYELKKKLLSNIQARSTDAQPNLQVVATQSTSNTLLSEIIHKDIDPQHGDVAIRQLQNEPDPSLAYAICIDDGIANIYDRVFPSYMDNPWNFVWSLGNATEVAIEFNGNWQISANYQWYYLATELTPYVFFVTGGTLYVQHWNDEDTRIPLATGVGEISACRGWQSSDDMLLDQGLIVAYLKNGEVYYRGFCLQASGETNWESERKISELGSNNTSICVFRTNDFRVGFICENSDGFHYVLSSRTYAGQSVKSESLYSQVVADCFLRAISIAYRTASDDNSSHVKASVSNEDCYIGCCMQFPEFKVLSTYRTSATGFVIETSHNLLKRRDLEQCFSIQLDVIETTQPVCVTVTIENNKIYITTDVEISVRQQAIFTLCSFSRLCFLTEQASPLEVPAFSVVFEPEIATDDKPQLTAALLQPMLTTTPIQYSETHQEESTAITTAYSCAFTATQVGDVPV